MDEIKGSEKVATKNALIDESKENLTLTSNEVLQISGKELEKLRRSKRNAEEGSNKVEKQ
jgi:hypothetical protein